MSDQVDVTGAVYREDGSDSGVGSAAQKTPDLFARLWAARRGGEVKRCHTIPIAGEYLNSTHQWNVVTLLLLLHPAPSLALIRACQFHDVAEHRYGDMPAQAKWEAPEVYGALQRLETRHLFHLGLAENLTKQDQDWLHALDKLELWLWAHEQVRDLGNRRAQVVIDRLHSWFWKSGAEMPQVLQDVWEKGPNSLTLLTTQEGLI